MLINTDVFEKRNKYLEKENNGEIGRPYEYPIESEFHRIQDK